MDKIFSLLSGLIFGLGLVVSGMADPQKVIGFLSITQNWDPSLAFVMGGAIAVGVVAFSLAKKRKASYLNKPMSLPTKIVIDKKLITGGILFGLGWGLSGICPGPGLVLLSLGQMKGIGFIIAMLVGMFLFEMTQKQAKIQ